MPTDARGQGDDLLVRVHDTFEEEFPEGSGLATECFLNLGRVAVAMLLELDRLLAGFGVPSYTSFNALTVLAGAGDPLSPSVVAHRMVVTRPTVTGVLDTLERRQLIKRSDDGSDGRRRLVTITDSGVELVRRVLPEVHRFEEKLFRDLEPSQQSTLLDSLVRIAIHLETLREEEPREQG